jgi:hypothetical protein
MKFGSLLYFQRVFSVHGQLFGVWPMNKFIGLFIALKIFKLIVFFLITFVSVDSYAAAVQPYSGRFNRTVTQTIHENAKTRGFAANDPRWAATTNALGVSSSIAITTGAAVTGVLAAVSAPVWASVGLGLAVGVTLAYLFYRSPNEDVIFTSGDEISPNTPAQVLKVQTLPGTPPQYHSDFFGNNLLSIDKSENLLQLKQSYVDANRLCNTKYVGYDSFSETAFCVDTITAFHDVINNSQTFFTNSGSYPNTTWSSKIIDSDFTTEEAAFAVQQNGLYPVIFHFSNAYYTSSGAPFVDTWRSILSLNLKNATASDYENAINALPDLTLDYLVSSQVIADLVDGIFLAATQQPDYQGIPYSKITKINYDNAVLSDPVITVTYRDLHQRPSPAGQPIRYPSPYDGVNRTNDPYTNAPAPSGSTQSPNPTPAPYTGSGASSCGASWAPCNINWGGSEAPPDPTVIADKAITDLLLIPQIELFRTFDYSIPDGTCPKPSFDFDGKSYVFEAHCNLLDENSALLKDATRVMFLILSIVIVLGA